MSTYQINLLLEALVGVYSSQELSAGEPVISCLVVHLGVDVCQAEALVEGALEIKEARTRLADHRSAHILIQ